MANFESAFTATLRHEDSQLLGVVTKDPTAKNPAAVARFGVNSGAHPNAVSDGFYTMDRDKALQYAADLYKYEYFTAIGGYQINDQSIANKYFDLAVNSGIREATEIVQRACNALFGSLEIGLSVDGCCGQKTIDAINKFSPADLMLNIKLQGAKFYREWAFKENKPQRLVDQLIARLNSVDV
jgi:lysozyme family protein